jgi:uncharacterized protein (TIGR03663 family)
MTLRSQNSLFLILFALILAVAFALRIPHLAERPMHGDEANQAVKTGMLYDKGVYKYDPKEHHGPTLYYAAQPLIWLSGAKRFADTTEIPYRLVPLIFGMLTIALLWPLRAGLGKAATFWAALFMAVSHAMVYFSRYYIQEMLFVCFVFATIVFGWRYLRTRRIAWAVLTGLSIGLTHATKETCVMVWACMAGALALTLIWTRLRDGVWLAWRSALRPLPLLLAFAAAAGVSILFFTSFFTHMRGPLDSILTYGTYLHRSQGAGSTGVHDKPWYYYFQLILYTYRTVGPHWTEGVLLGLATIGGLVVWKRRDTRLVSPGSSEIIGDCPYLMRFLGFYGVLLTAFFTVLPYKTPWNMLIFFQPMILLAGVGAAWLVRVARWQPLRALVAAGLLAAAGHLAWQTHLGTTLYAADARNPYVYAHTSTALFRLTERIDALQALVPEGRHIRINVIQPDGDYWPLPWYLRAYDRVGYYPGIPDAPDAAIIIADGRLREALSAKLKGHYQIEMGALRPSVLRQVLIRQDLWDAFMSTRTGAS